MVQIRNAREEDCERIVRFQMAMALETEALQLEKLTVWEGVMNVLRDAEKGKYFVAQIEDAVVGSLLITMEWSDWRSRWILWLQSVYVLPEHRNKGIFKKMYGFIKTLAEEDKEVAGLRLYVDKSNKKAIEVYRKLGINGDHYQVLEWMKEEK